MAVSTPKVLIPTGAMTSTPTAYVSPAGGFGIIRTINAIANAGSITLTVALGADAAGTRIMAATVPQSPASPLIINGWNITPTNSAHAIDASSNGTGTQCIATISGYEYV